MSAKRVLHPVDERLLEFYRKNPLKPIPVKEIGHDLGFHADSVRYRLRALIRRGKITARKTVVREFIRENLGRETRWLCGRLGWGVSAVNRRKREVREALRKEGGAVA